MGRGMVGAGVQGLLELPDRFLELPAVGQHAPKIAVRHDIIGPDRQGPVIMGHRFLDAAQAGQGHAQVVMGSASRD